MQKARMLRPAVLLLVVMMLLSACASGDEEPDSSDQDGAAAGDDGDDAAGDDADDSGDGPDEEDTESTATSRVAEILEELDGLEGQERQDALLAMALEEGNVLNVYTSNSDLAPLVSQFQDLTGIDVGLFVSISSAVTQRALQESQAGFPGADVIQVTERDQRALSDEGLLTPFSSPLSDDLIPAVVFEDWVGTNLAVGIGCWNTDTYSPDEVPETWEEALTSLDGAWAFEVRQFEWFSMIVEEHLMGDLGYTEEEAIDLFRERVQGASGVRGSDLIAGLVGAGEYDFAAGGIHHICSRVVNDGGPLAVEPIIEPALGRPNGPGILATTERPATALLWIEFLISPAGQEIIAQELGRTPTHLDTDGGLPAGTDLRVIDPEKWDDPAEVEKWQGTYDDLMRGVDSLHE